MSPFLLPTSVWTRHLRWRPVTGALWKVPRYSILLQCPDIKGKRVLFRFGLPQTRLPGVDGAPPTPILASWYSRKDRLGFPVKSRGVVGGLTGHEIVSRGRRSRVGGSTPVRTNTRGRLPLRRPGRPPQSFVCGRTIEGGGGESS